MSSKELSVTRLALLHKKKRNCSGHPSSRAKFAGIGGFGEKNSNETKTRSLPKSAGTHPILQPDRLGQCARKAVVGYNNRERCGMPLERP